MFRGVHLKLVFKKNKVYGSKEKVRGNNSWKGHKKP